MKTVLTLMLCSSIFFYGNTQVLSAGDIMFVGLNCDGNDGIAFVVLKEIPANTTIFFTDNEWNGSAFTTNECYFQWSNSSKTNLGTVVSITETHYLTLSASSANPVVNIGTAIWSTIIAPNRNADFSGTAEVIYAYLGSDYLTPTTFLTAFANGGFNSTNGVITNTGLTSGTDAIEFSAAKDVLWYNNSTVCTGTIADCRSLIVNTANWGNADGTGDQTASYTPPITGFSGSALPVQLTQFTSKPNNNSITLSWKTASETQNDHFDIEHATIGTDFKKIGFVKGHGTTPTGASYTYTHNTPSVGNNFYRLKQVDFDTHYEYSKIIEIPFGTKIFSISPSLTDSYLQLTTSEDKEETYFLFNFQGQIIEKGRFQQVKRLDVSHLPNGIYFIKTGETPALKFIKN